MADRVPGFSEPNPETQAFWDAAKEGKFLVKKCTACGKTHWYPRAICPFCMSEKTEWVQASGRGKIYSYSHMSRANPPFTIAYVTLAEGPTMLTNIVDTDAAKLKIGADVKLVFKPSEKEYPVPMFTAA
jgi:uncharacterized OB-fold protein